MIDYENLNLLNAPFEEELKIAFENYLEKGWYILGNEVSEFESEFASYLGVEHVVGVASGLDALQLCLKVNNYPRGSEVIVPSNTYIATILAIVNEGLIPVLVEPDIKTYNIDVNRLEKKINSKTVAIMPVHLYGKPCQMDGLLEVCKIHKLDLVEDCAQSHGATFNNKQTGTFGLGAFSFYPTKNLGAFGDGGAISTSSIEIAEKLRALRNYGSEKKYNNKYVGLNSRLDELQAAFLRIKLRNLDKINQHKIELAELYFKGLDTTKFILPVRSANTNEVFHIFNIRTKFRDKLKTYLLAHGVKSEIHYPIPPHKQIGYQHYFQNEKYPISEEIHATTLSLPISFCHTENNIKKVIQIANSFQC